VKVRKGIAPGEPKKADVEKAFAWVRDIRPGLAVLLAEDFEKTAPGGLPGAFRVERPGVWAVRELDGNRVLAGEGDKTTAGFGEAGWRDYEVRLRFRFDAFPSAVGLVVRHDPATGRNYQLELHPGGACLRRSLDASRDDPDVVRGRGRARPASGVWHALRVSCRGEIVELWVDGKLVLRSRETLAARGRCKLYVRSGTVYFDDISVREVGP
jgi:hypothetical protein